MKQTTRQLIFKGLTLLAALGLIAVGCASGPKTGKPVPWTVKIKKSTPASIAVDLVGISPSEDSHWRRAVKPSDYWSPNSLIREQVKSRARTTTFETEQEFVLKRDDPIWKEWTSYGSSELLIMASLPGKFSNDEFDPRRQIVSLGKNAWQTKNQTLEIEISDTQVRVVTPPRQ